MNLPKVTQLVRGKAGVGTQVVQLWSPCSELLPYIAASVDVYSVC